MKKIVQPVYGLLLFAALVASGCGKPSLNGLDPASGPPGTIVEVQGSKLFGATVLWDAGLATETAIPSNFLSARFFTVPPAATPGDHPVRLKIGSTLSDNTINFNVSGAVLRPNPRIDYVTCYGYNVKPDGKISLFLMVSGANLDVGAKIRINGTDQFAFISNVMRNPNLTATTPTTLQYPIPNYCMLWTVLGDQSAGNVNVQVVNLDGGTSNTIVYRIADSLASLDSDGDGLLDDWEINGYDADGNGTIDVDLPALGANPHHKDLFVEVDWMNGFAPNNAIWNTIEAAFANAPIMNANGGSGIAIHIDRGQAGAGGGGGTVLTATNFIRYDNSQVSGPGSTVNLYTLKSANFNANRLNIYRYCIFANDNGYSPGSSGQAEDIWANDLFVSLGAFVPAGGTNNQQVGTFIHEFGHTLNLRHGGFENTNRKPSYNSIMRYGDPGQFNGIDTDCDNRGNTVYTYSQGMRADLNENSLNENLGVCDNNAIDWNGNGAIQNPVSVSINSDATLATLRDFADWANLQLGFTAVGSGWASN
ncbi:MAG: hypothetical protein IPL49_15530 [Saprospirales bacterium]|nr:hypothetical protein [Saprospirales bacterium]